MNASPTRELGGALDLTRGTPEQEPGQFFPPLGISVHADGHVFG